MPAPPPLPIQARLTAVTLPHPALIVVMAIPELVQKS